MANFPKGFIWGAASSAYQIEGGTKEGYRGISIWDTFSHTPGKVKNAENGDIAADSYHRWRDDVELLQGMGLQAYRFSLAWPRIAPTGDTNWNAAGLAWYDTLIDALLAAGIEPWVTLYHWDLPQALQNHGGWQNRETVNAFAAYAAKVGEHFKGRVRHWITLNEPQCFIGMGYGTGEHAPGLVLSAPELEKCWKNIRLAHTLAANALHRIDTKNLVGLSSTGDIYYPAADTAEDIEAARQMTFSCPKGAYSFAHTLALDGITDTLDFIGLNIYHGAPVRMGKAGPERVAFPAGYPRTAMDWPVSPKVMEWGPKLIGERYGLPMYITENGLSCRDWISEDGAAHDTQRVDFLTRYLRALGAGIQAGADVRGYFQWSLTDNFEWAEGYNQRFGLAYVDYATGKRTAKDSAAWYRDTVRQNGANL